MKILILLAVMAFFAAVLVILFLWDCKKDGKKKAAVTDTSRRRGMR